MVAVMAVVSEAVLAPVSVVVLEEYGERKDSEADMEAV